MPGRGNRIGQVTELKLHRMGQKPSTRYTNVSGHLPASGPLSGKGSSVVRLSSTDSSVCHVEDGLEGSKTRDR